MRFAIIPWADKYLKDRMFDIDDPAINYDNRQEPYLDMQKEFERKGHELHTIDLFENLEEVDYFLFFELEWHWILKISKLNKLDRMVYCNAEPPSVNAINSPDGYQYLKHFFPYIMSWNSDWVDGKIIYKRNIPYYFKQLVVSNIPFEEKKLLTSISGYKKSDYPGELYSERERLIDYFEQNYPQDFDFYGSGWDKQGHSCYRGHAGVKAEVYQKYRFALCLENIGGIKGYITEKILDCLTAGIVPVYLGATDICEYIPKNCFVDYRKFKTYDDLAKYLLVMKEDEYNRFLQVAADFLNSDAILAFSGQQYAQNIIDAVSNRKKFEINRKDMREVAKNAVKQNRNKWIIRSKIRIKGYFGK